MTLVFVALLAWTARRRAPLVFLAAALALVAANHAIEVVRASGGGSATLLKTATVLAALDPFFLLYFATIHRQPSRWSSLAIVIPFLLLGAALAGRAAWIGRSVSADASYFGLLGLYTAAAYTLALVATAGNARREPGSAWPPLLIALSILAHPVWGSAAYWLTLPLRASGGDAQSWLTLALGVALPVLVAGALALRGHARPILLGLAAGLLVVLVRNATFLVGAAGGAGSAAERVAIGLGQSSGALRWLAIGALLAAALVRHDALGMPASRREPVARVLAATFVGVGALAGLGLAYAAVGASMDVRPAEVVVLGVALLASQVFTRLTATVRRVLLPGETPSWSDPLAPGATIGGRYRVGRLLGRGSQGNTFAGEDTLLGRPVALKEFVRADPGSAAAVAEARKAGAVRSPHVVTVHDVFVAEDREILVLELVDGGSLASLLAEEGKLPAARALPIVLDALEGLAAAHDAGIVHRDLKPANVLLDGRGRAKIGDFGLARLETDATVAQGGVFAGTPRFMAPEQREGRPVSFAADVYAMGIVLRDVLAPPLPAEIDAVVARATHPAPEARYADAREMREALAAAGANAEPGGSAGL